MKFLPVSVKIPDGIKGSLERDNSSMNRIPVWIHLVSTLTAIMPATSDRFHDSTYMRILKYQTHWSRKQNGGLWTGERRKWRMGV